MSPPGRRRMESRVTSCRAPARRRGRPPVQQAPSCPLTPGRPVLATHAGPGSRLCDPAAGAARHRRTPSCGCFEGAASLGLEGPNPIAFLLGQRYWAPTCEALLAGLGPTAPYFADRLRQNAYGTWRLPFHPQDTHDPGDLVHGDHWADWTATDCPALLIMAPRASSRPSRSGRWSSVAPAPYRSSWRPITSSPPLPLMRSPPWSRRSSPRSRQPGLAPFPRRKRAGADESVSGAASAPRTPLPS